MDYFKKQFETIQQNLAGLNATQKMLTGALVAIMAMTMVYWSRYAGTAEMEPVLNQTLTDEDVTRMAASLDSRGIPNKVEGTKLLVSADRKMQALATLSFDQLLPHDTTSGFDQMMAKGSPWDTPGQREALMNHGREITLAQVIGGFPNVANAVVMIDSRSERHLGSPSVSPTATISITMRNRTNADNKVADSAADLVCGAVADMNRAKIKVVIDGHTRAVRDNSSDEYSNSSEQLEAIQSYEHNASSKIESQLRYIDGVVASVTGMLNTQAETTMETKNDEKGTLVLPKTTDNTNNETTSSNSGGEVPGAGSNVGVALSGSGGGGGNTSTESHDHADNVILAAQKQTTTKKPAGDFTILSASVRVPRSYFIGILKGRSGGKDPSESEIDDYVKSELVNIRESVRACTYIKKDDDIFVGTYAEAMPATVATSTAGVSVTGTGISGLVGGWGKEVGVGALAVVSLFMVSTMVKRSTPAPLVVAAAESKSPASLAASEDVAGFASEGGATLAGMELDEDAVQTQQVLDQVTTLVGENPEGAANLVKRWMNRT